MQKLRNAVIAIAVLCVIGLVAFWMVMLSDPWRMPLGDWWRYKARFISQDGRVIDTGNGNVSHSEGQGYAMLLAVAYGDRWTFDRLWTWTRTHLQTRPNDKLLSWLWKPSNHDGGGAVADVNNASDAEVLVAWALLRASKRWNHYEYQQAAAEMLADLRRLAVRNSSQGPYLRPGLEGFEQPDGVVLNLSYSVFPALMQFEESFPGSGWGALSASGLQKVGQARFGRWNLPPDWVLCEGLRPPAAPVAPAAPDQAPVPMVFRLPKTFPPDFGYNAIRIPLHIAWENPKSPLLKPFAEFWREFGDVSKIPSKVNLETNAFDPDPAMPGLVTLARFILACESGNRLTVRDLPPVMSDEPYYSASLKLLTKLAVRETLGGKP